MVPSSGLNSNPSVVLSSRFAPACPCVTAAPPAPQGDLCAPPHGLDSNSWFEEEARLPLVPRWSWGARQDSSSLSLLVPFTFILPVLPPVFIFVGGGLSKPCEKSEGGVLHICHAHHSSHLPGLPSRIHAVRWRPCRRWSEEDVRSLQSH